MTRRILLPSLALGASILFSQAQDAKIDTVAGNGEIGFFGDGGKALEAALHQPFGVVVSPAGDIVFCDTNNHVIRRISRKKRTIETIVGTGEKGWSGDGGPPSEAKLNEPYEIRFHPSGDLYGVERMSHTVRKLDARTNIVSTIAGTGEAGFSGDGGPGTSAAMSQPHSIQFDQSGKRLFVCDIKNHRIRAIDILTGIISTWCGTGKPEATKDGAKVSPDTPLKGPRALDRAPNGDIWLALREGNQLFRIDHEKETLHHVAGTGKKGFHAEDRNALESELSGPKGVAISPDGKMIYLADTESHTVRVVDLNESPPVLKLVAGTGKKGDGPDSPDPIACAMARLHGIGTDPITGDLYIGDSETHKVRKVSGLTGPGKNPPLSAYETATFEVAGRACKLTKPRSAAPGKPWIWRCRFYGAFPNVDEALLAAGWHIAWIDVANLFGAEAAMEAFDEFYAAIVKRGKLNDRPVMEGFSRGGLPAMNWAIRHPDKVSGVYLDAPVLDIHTWPKKTSPNLWKPCMEVYGLTEETAGDWRGPLDNFAPLVENKIPIFIVAGGNDAPVPWSKNGSILEKRVTESGGDISVIVKAACGHHPHSLHDAAPVVEWAKRVVAK